MEVVRGRAGWLSPALRSHSPGNWPRAGAGEQPGRRPGGRREPGRLGEGQEVQDGCSRVRSRVCMRTHACASICVQCVVHMGSCALGCGFQVQVSQLDKQALHPLPSAPAHPCSGTCTASSGWFSLPLWLGRAPPLWFSALQTSQLHKIKWRLRLKILRADKNHLSHGGKTKSNLFPEHERKLT